ncbi:hypothetical protein R1flu_001158 [Riccia fluitans]|uniref:Protein kinase domain-containing protein n=1 Tax=Riccia fluitans TaxID=41844 RepID=A0ABD1Y2G2_9MARC
MNVLDLADNKLWGIIPPELGQLRKLQVLDLSRHKFTGTIPAILGADKASQRLDLSNNNLQGGIPSSLGQLTDLRPDLRKGQGERGVVYRGLPDVGRSGEVPVAMKDWHHEAQEQVIPCDLKPSNILLDRSFQAQISDFGITRFDRDQDGFSISCLRGTRGYIPPEHASSPRVSTKTTTR